MLTLNPKPTIHLGYCCISSLHPEFRCSRCSTKTYLETMPKEQCKPYLLQKAKDNLMDLKKLLLANLANNILAYRVPEQLLPQIDLGYYSIDLLTDELVQVGEVANQYDLQLSNHPSQYFVLNSARPDVVHKTLHSINLIAETFEVMQLNRTPNIVLHIGGKKGYATTQDALNAFCHHYKDLSPSAQRFLVVENDATSFTVSDCLHVHEQIGIPIVFDNCHYKWNPGQLHFQDAVTACLATWGTRTPKCHLSTDRPGNKHAHSDFIALSDFLELSHAIYNSSIPACYVMLECKEKDRAILKLREQLINH